MSWGFRRKNEKSITLHQTIGRIINRGFSIREAFPDLQKSEEHRSESRSKYNTPLVVFGFDDNDSNARLTVGATIDLSLDGAAAFLTGRIRKGPAVVALGPSENRVLIAAECLQCSPRELGSFFTRFRFSETLNQNAVPQVVMLIEQLEAQSAAKDLTAVKE
jgi:hypothetical protein